MSLEFKGSDPRKVIKLGESCPCQATGLADEAEGRSNKSWPVAQKDLDVYTVK